MTIIEALKYRTSTTEARLAARFKPIRVRFQAGMKASQVAEACAMMDRMQKIARGK